MFANHKAACGIDADVAFASLDAAGYSLAMMPGYAGGLPMVLRRYCGLWGRGT